MSIGLHLGARSMFQGERFKNSKTRRFFGGKGHLRGFFLFLFCLWVLKVSLSHCSTQYLYKTRGRQKLVSQLPVFVHYVCEGGGQGSASTGGSQRLVYRRLEATNMLHRGTVRLHRLHVLVEDGEDLVVEDLVLPNAVRHLLQRLQKKKEGMR